MDNPIIKFFIELIGLVFIQLVAVFAIFFVLGYVLHILQKQTQKHYQKGLGWRSIYLTAWIGTPIHELSHLLFIKIFLHKVTEVSLFKPDPKTGNLGRVTHSYNNKSVYQLIGLFFIGAAPLMFGSFFLMLLTYTTLPNGKDIFATLFQQTPTINNALLQLATAAYQLFSPANLTEPAFWIFLYIAFSIAAHMAPSKQDRKNMYTGLLWIIILMILINIIPLLLGVSLVGFAEGIGRWLSITFGFFFLAIILSAAHMIITYLLLYLPAKAIRRK